MTDQGSSIQKYLDQGISLHRAGKLEEAENIYRLILENQPEQIHALNNLGSALQEQGHNHQAIEYFRKAISVDSGNSHAWYNLGNALRADQQLEATVEAYRKAIDLNPQFANTYNNLGLCLQDLRRLDEAVAVYRKAASLSPDSAEVYNNLGNVLQQQGKLTEAITYLEKAFALKKDYADAHNNLGVAFQKQGKLAEAIVQYQKAIAIRPDYPDAHCNLGHVLLLRGDFKNGFEEYEWRWKVRGINYLQPRPFKQSLWDGSDLAGKTILLHAEQGYGDTLHFIRYAPMVAKKGARVIVECQPLLTRLLNGMPGIHQVISRGEKLPDFDVHSPLLSLPGLFGTTPASISDDVPYIKPPVTDAAKWNISQTHQLNIGIVWAGSPTHANDFNRSCTVEHFKTILDVQGIDWFSLQKEGVENGVSELMQYTGRLTDLSRYLNDFADTAAAIEKMDLVITVDTAVAHLAGAMGKPVWVLLPYIPDWRWMMERLDSPWYPTMLLFRQSEPGNWNGVFKRVRQVLQSTASAIPERTGTSQAENDLSAKKQDAFRKDDSRQRKIMAQAAYHLYAVSKRDCKAEDALNLLRKASANDPDSVIYPFEEGCLLQDAGRFEASLEAFDRALQRRSDLAAIHNNRGNTLKLLSRFAEAEHCYRQALKIQPESPEIHTNLGVCLADQGFKDDAEQCYRKALDIKPDHASAHWNYGLLLLSRGDYERGWNEYEWRRKVKNYETFFVNHKKPQWRGETLADRTILLHYEQGLGDTLQFVRYAPLVAQKCFRVIIQCQPELVRLLQASIPETTVISADEAVPVHDAQCSLMSLPSVFKTSLKSIPSKIPYLKPEERLVSKWESRIGRNNNLKAGIVWAGKLWNDIPAAKSIDQRRSLNPELLRIFSGISGATFYSLQMGPAANDLRLPKSLNMIDLTGGIQDFADTAAMVAHLDLIICVDTSIAHLAGAMGKPVWVMSRFDACWRWLQNRADSPWYPTMKLFRQSTPGNWEDVLEQVARELKQKAGNP